MRLVADWQLHRAEPQFNQDWTYAALYAGFMAVPLDVNGKKYQEAMLAMGSGDWANLCRAYEKYRDRAKIAPTLERMENLTRRVDNPDDLLWWWCDALLMAPPVLTELNHADWKTVLARFHGL
jgi:unsaturated rhamnogalacturonyl hydrolase